MNDGYIGAAKSAVKAGVVRTFYVVRRHGNFVEFTPRGSRNITGTNSAFFSPDHVDQFASVIDAAGSLHALPKGRLIPLSEYEIVRVDRETTPGATVRRALKDGEVVPTNAKWALKSNYNGFFGPGFGSIKKGWCNEVKTADLFTRQEDALFAFANYVQGSGYASGCNGIVLVRVVEETLPGTTKDTLTVVA